jgi:four helix bundle protein
MRHNTTEQFHDKLKRKMDEYVHLVYNITRDFPQSELYGATSQLRRAALSIILNYIEGYSRKRRLVKINFFETSYGSLQESKYLLEFAQKEAWLKEDEYQHVLQLAEEIGAMLWRTIENLSHES